jgi:polysaccharide biosynthesis transport protein
MNTAAESHPFPPENNGNNLPRSTAYYPGAYGENNEDKQEYRQFLAMLQRRALVITGVAAIVTAGIVAQIMKEQPVYQGSFQLLIGPLNSDTKFDPMSLATKSGGSLVSDSLDLETQLRVLASPQTMASIVKKIQLKYPEINYNSIISKLSLKQVGATKILDVSYLDSKPERIQYVLSAIAEGYVEYSQKQQQNSLGKGIEFVEEQLPKLQIRVDKLQEQLQLFRQYYNLIEPQSQGQYLSGRVNDVLQQRIQTQTELKEAQTMLKTVEGQIGGSPQVALAATALNESPVYQQLLGQLKEIETKLAIESARFTTESPGIQLLLEQRQNVLSLLGQQTQQILGTSISGNEAQTLTANNGVPQSIRTNALQKLIETSNQIRILQVRQKALGEAENYASSQLKNMAVIARKYTDLQRELTVATDSLNRFLGVREQLQIQSAQNTVPWQILAQPQQPQLPISPNIPRSLMMGILIGLAAGIGAAVLVDKLDNVFHLPEDIKDATGLALLGSIPYKKYLRRYGGAISDVAANSLPTERSERGSNYYYSASAFLEAFRSLHANLYFTTPDKPLRSLVISSAVPGDGKSTVSLNLAQAAAAMGQRVLLVDADLRRPQIHRLTDLPNVWGLSNLISSDMNLDEVIQHTSLEENLHVLTAGQIPPDPTRLLSSKKMISLIESLQEDYDLVIFDTPPMLGLADGRILAAHTDGMLLVAGLGRTPRNIIKQAIENTRVARVPILGIVANGVKESHNGSYDYYQRYYTRVGTEQTTTGSTGERL